MFKIGELSKLVRMLPRIRGTVIRHAGNEDSTENYFTELQVPVKNLN